MLIVFFVGFQNKIYRSNKSALSTHMHKHFLISSCLCVYFTIPVLSICYYGYTTAEKKIKTKLINMLFIAPNLNRWNIVFCAIAAIWLMFSLSTVVVCDTNTESIICFFFCEFVQYYCSFAKWQRAMLCV